jgi:hypothetical protein
VTLQRLVLDFRSEAGELVVRCLYRAEISEKTGLPTIPWPGHGAPRAFKARRATSCAWS